MTCLSYFPDLAWTIRTARNTKCIQKCTDLGLLPVLSRCLDVTKTMFYLIVFNKKKRKTKRADGRTGAAPARRKTARCFLTARFGCLCRPVGLGVPAEWARTHVAPCVACGCSLALSVGGTGTGQSNVIPGSAHSCSPCHAGPVKHRQECSPPARLHRKLTEEQRDYRPVS
jgi:hypothetical protein